MSGGGFSGAAVLFFQTEAVACLVRLSKEGDLS